MPLTELQKEVITDEITKNLMEKFSPDLVLPTAESDLATKVFDTPQTNSALTLDYLNQPSYSSSLRSKILASLPANTENICENNLSWNHNRDEVGALEEGLTNNSEEEESLGENADYDYAFDEADTLTEENTNTDYTATADIIPESANNAKVQPTAKAELKTAVNYHQKPEDSIVFPSPAPTFPAFQTNQSQMTETVTQPGGLSTLAANASTFQEAASTAKKLSEIQKDKNQIALAQAEEEKHKNGSNFLVTGADWVQRNLFDRIAGWMPIGFLKSAVQMIGNTLTGLFKTVGHLFDGKVGDALSSGWSWLKDTAIVGGTVAGALVARKQIKKLNKEVTTLTETNNTVQASNTSVTSNSDVPLAQTSSVGGLKTLATQMPVSTTESEMDAVTLAQKANQRHIG